MYADDLRVLSASVGGLQFMLDCCYIIMVKPTIWHSIQINLFVAVLALVQKILPIMLLGNISIAWINSFKYLGVTFNNNY